MQVPKGLYRLQKRKDTNENTTTSGFSSVSSSSISSSSPSANADGVSSNGCVVCSSTPECPRCGPNEQCAMTTQTCLECPTTYCLNVSESINSTASKSTLSSAEIGGIAGGLSGFVFILLIGGVYYLIRKYAKRVNVDYELGINEEMKGLAGAFDLDEDDENENENENYGGNLKGTRNDKRRTQFHDPQKRMSQNSLATMTNSVLTKASNVLNIVYVPGVTSNRPTKTTFGGNRRLTRKPAESIYSKGMSIYSKETYFSDLEDASFHGGNVAMRGAHPRLVEIKQDDYDFDEGEDSGHVKFANSDEEIEENEEDTDSNFRIDINLRLPERRNINDDIMEEEEEEGEEEEKDRGINVLYDDVDLLDDGYNAADEENYHEDGEDIQLNIGVIQPSGSSNNRAMPTRYAALIEKKEKTKLDPFIDPHDDIDENSFSDSFSDSDEENIELLLQNNGSVPGNDNNPFLSSQD
jgi:hypothetical protein